MGGADYCFAILYCSSSILELKMDSLEYQTLNMCYDSLVSCIGQSPKDIVDKLIPSGVLAPGVLKFLENPNNSDDDKARKIINVVIKQVEINVDVYNVLTEVLKTSTWTKAVAVKLEQMIQKKMKSQSLCSADNNESTLEQDTSKYNFMLAYHNIIIMEFSVNTYLVVK